VKLTLQEFVGYDGRVDQDFDRRLAAFPVDSSDQTL